MTDILKLPKAEVIQRLRAAIEQDMHTVDDTKMHTTIQREANERMQLNMRVVELLEAQE